MTAPGDAAEFRELTFGELTSRAFAVEPPLRFRVPAAFVAVPRDGGLHTWWMSVDDRDRHERDDAASLHDGFFSVTLTLNMGYDPVSGRFFGGGEGDGDEAGMAAGYAAAGVEDVAVDRYDVAGVPVLFMEGRQGERRITMCYVATGIDTNVVFLFYVHPMPYREVDGRRWGEMRRGILSSGE